MLRYAALGIALAIVGFLFNAVQHIPVRPGVKSQEDDAPVYNLIELSAPVVAGPLAKVISYILARTWLSPFLIRNLLNNNGAHLLRQMAIEHCKHLGPTTFPVHHVEKDNRREITSWSNTSEIVLQRGLDLGFSSPPPYYGIMDYHRLYESKRATPIQVMERWLAGAQELESLHMFAYLDADDVRKQAKASADRWRSDEGPLSVWDGVPVAIKDMSAIAGIPICRGSSQCSQDDTDDFPAKRLREVGAIIVGTTVMTEGGVTPLGYSAFFDGPFNPYSTEHYSGGSSGGSAVAVATGLVPMAVGWDGGGSIRIPASMCGTFGLATTAGRIPSSDEARHSVTKAGPLAATIEDVALSHILLGKVEESSFYSKLYGGVDYFPKPHLHGLLESSRIQYPSQSRLSGVRVGVFWDHFSDTSAEVYEACHSAVQSMERHGATIVNITIPNLREIHFSHALRIVSEFALDWDDRFADPEYEIEANTEITLALGRTVSSVELLAADTIRTWAIEYVLKLYKNEDLDAIVSPAMGTSVPKPPSGYRGYGESNTPLVYRIMRYIPLANFLGLPSLVVNAGYEKDLGLPIGLQLLGAPWSEARLIKLGGLVQELVPSRRRPKHFFDVLGKWGGAE